MKVSQKKQNGHRFKAASKATIEDLKYRNIGGHLNDSFQFFLRVPRELVIANVIDRPLVLTSSENKELRGVIASATSTSITEINEKTVLLKLTVAEPYLKLVIRDLRILEGAEIQLRSKLI